MDRFDEKPLKLTIGLIEANPYGHVPDPDEEKKRNRAEARSRYFLLSILAREPLTHALALAAEGGEHFTSFLLFFAVHAKSGSRTSFEAT